MNDFNSLPVREANLAVIERFFELFARDKAGFMSLWADNPVVTIPFTPPGFPSVFDTAELFASFWHRIFTEISGAFNWTIVDRIVGENPNEIVVVSRSEVNATLNHAPLVYAANYLQIFRFHDRKITAFTEYVDTAAMAKVYNF